MFINKKFKRILSIVLIFFILTVRPIGPVFHVIAEEQESTPSAVVETSIEENNDPTPTPTIPQETHIEASNSAQVENNIDSSSNTGNNTASQSAQIDEMQNNDTNTNSDNEGEESEGGGEKSEVETGDAISVTEIENTINTNYTNSKVYNHTINIFVNENGDIDLSDPFLIAQNIITEEHNLDEVVNVMASDNDNYAYLSNDVVTISDSGSNNIEEATVSAEINTGNSISITTLLNQVNFTIIGSTIHIITINIFGDLTGNIILPEFSSLESCSNCGMSIATESEAVVNNNVTSYANTGGNNIEYIEEAEINTGDAQSIVNVSNIINQNIFGMLLFNLTINNYGNWNGEFLGWSDIFGLQSAGNLLLNFISAGSGEGCSQCSLDNVSIYNSAYVENNISSNANTGGNSINGKNGTINTGNAYSSVTLANFVNSNIINSVGFFGFINIFGYWTGNIGGESHFVEDDNDGNDGNKSENTKKSSSNNGKRESGGLLNVTNENNVGEYVNPGDTVTFFMDVSNPGTGKIYDTTLYLYLVYEGENVGGTTFELGEIQPGKKKKVSTGFVLSEFAPGGNYTAVAVAKGYAGEDKVEILAASQSYFVISGDSYYEENFEAGDFDEDNESVVLGTTNSSQNPPATNANQGLALASLFVFFVSSYIFMQAIRKREDLAKVFGGGLTFRERIYSFRLFLL